MHDKLTTTSKVTRRNFLAVSLGGASVLAGASAFGISACKSPTQSPSVNRNSPNRLRIPPTITGGNLSAANGAALVWPGPSSNVITINGMYTGPTIRVQQNSLFNSTFVNQLGERSIIHWHGLDVPADMDGHPRSTIESGNSYAYDFTVIQRAGTYWYHAHPDMGTAKQVYKGLAGMLIVEDPQEKSLNLPAGTFEIPLLLQDTRSVDGNAIDYNPTHEDIMTGFLGNAVLVNGTPNAFLEVQQGLYRFRLVNASNARVYAIAFSDNRKFFLIATDGGLIAQPQQMTTFNLSPGERAEILVDFSGDPLQSSVQLKSAAYDFVSSHRGAPYPQGMELNILDCRVTAETSTHYTIPASLSSVDSLQQTNPDTRVFVLTMDHSKPSGMHMINNLVYDINRIDINVKQGDVELWEIQNNGDAYHSMHIHGGQFQIVERLYAGLITPVDTGWKDTVLLYPNETVRILVTFKNYKGLYLFHCHTLEHEDDGMMLNVMVA